MKGSLGRRGPAIFSSEVGIQHVLASPINAGEGDNTD